MMVYIYHFFRVRFFNHKGLSNLFSTMNPPTSHIRNIGNVFVVLKFNKLVLSKTIGRRPHRNTSGRVPAGRLFTVGMQVNPLVPFRTSINFPSSPGIITVAFSAICNGAALKASLMSFLWTSVYPSFFHPPSDFRCPDRCDENDKRKNEHFFHARLLFLRKYSRY